MKFSVVAALPYYWLLLGGGFVIDRAPHPVAAQYYDSTTYAVLLPQARGKIPNAYGPVKARVSATRQLSVQFNLLAGTGYVAGNVTATTNPRGQVVQLAKGKQTCKIQYNSTGTVLRVTCTTRARRDLGGVTNDPDEADRDPNSLSGADGAATAEGESQLPSERRLGPSCGACTSVVSSALTTGIRSICGGTPFARAVPAPYRWAKAAATAMCALRTKLGNPLHVAYGTCRCPCYYLNPEVCPSRVCSMSTDLCMAEKLRIGAGCRYSFDCVNFQCAWSTYTSTTRVCCPSNETVGDVRPDGFYDSICAASGELGWRCGSRGGCKSGICVNGFCASQRLEGGKACDYDDACENRKCSYGKFPAEENDDYQMCCPTNASVGMGEEYCTEISDVGGRCDDNSICKSGICSGGFCLSQKLADGEGCPDVEDEDCMNGVCAYGPISLGEWICCPSNASSQGYCTDTTELGDPCMANKACKSGVCSSNICIAQRHEIGRPCPDMEDDDCQNGVCGRAFYPTGDFVCCPSNRSTYPYCDATQSVGDRCDKNQQCVSGVCSNKTCIAERFEAGHPCPDIEDGDCQNGACGRASYPDGAFVCCPSNNRTGPDWNPYCTATEPLGEPCEYNPQCLSGVCSNRTCIAQKHATGEPCPDGMNEDCQNGACGLASFPTGPYVCCPSHNRTLAWVTIDRYDYLKYYCDATQAVDEPCSANQQCISGVCSNRTCVAQRHDAGDPCPDGEDDDCAAGVACGRASFPAGPYVCCPNSPHHSRTGSYCDATQGVGMPCNATAQCSAPDGVCTGGACRGA